MFSIIVWMLYQILINFDLGKGMHRFQYNGVQLGKQAGGPYEHPRI